MHFLLYALSDFLSADVDKGRKVRKAYGLTAVLVRRNLSDNLSCNIAGGGEAVWLLNHSTADNRAVLKHVLKVDKVAVVHMLGEIICIVEVDYTLLVRLYDFAGEKNTVGNIL